jgi:hypothetical protein
MSSDDNDATEAMAEFQRRARDLLRAQQEAFLAAVKAWRDSASQGAPAWPPGPLGLTPRPEEVAEASYTFAAKLLADQSRFMEELSTAMSSEEKHRD